MGALDDLLGKKKSKPTPIGDSAGDLKPNVFKDVFGIKNALNKTEEIQTPIPEPTGFTLKIGNKPNAEIPHAVQSKTAGTVDSGDDYADPFAGLAGALSGISFDTHVLEKPEGIPETDLIPEVINKQFQNPTLSDVEKFVFEEQPDSSTEEITETFSTMLDDLSLATGDQVPTNVARCLKFIKEHDFLADILRPEAIGVLVNGLRKSYGFIVKTKTEKGAKKAKQNEKVSAVLDSLADLSF